jgi:hypothetical protein
MLQSCLSIPPGEHIGELGSAGAERGFRGVLEQQLGSPAELLALNHSEQRKGEIQTSGDAAARHAVPVHDNSALLRNGTESG